MKKPHLVRSMKKYGQIRVANAMSACGWTWKRPSQRPRSVEKMVIGLPRCELERILAWLQRRGRK